MRTTVLRLAAVLPVLAAPLSAQTRPISYDDYYRIERAGGVALSPDGRRVAFVRSHVLEEENRTHSEIWLVDADGSSPRHAADESCHRGDSSPLERRRPGPRVFFAP